MVATTAVRQKLRVLCHDKPWIYAVFWKLKNHSDLLTWEDGYIDNGKSDAHLTNALYHGVLSGKCGTTYFCCKMDLVSGKLILCPTHVAMAGILHDSYAIGEGVLHKRQSADTHVWIAATDLSSDILLDCLPEWQLQFAAGIKTVVLVPVIPLGVVQLGSLDMVEEDLNVVAYIKDFFGTLQHTAAACTDMALRLGHVNPLSSVQECLVENLLSSSLIGNLPDPIQFQQSWGRDFMAFDNGHKNGDEIFSSDHHPYPLFVPEVDFPHQIVTAQVMKMGEELCEEESIWKIIYGELLGDPNNVIFDHRLCEEEITQISMNLPDNSNLSHDVHDICFAENMSDETLWKNFEAGTMIDDQPLSFPTYCELHKALGSGFLEQHADHTWNISLSKIAQSNCASRKYETIIEESKAWLANGNDTGLLLDAVITHSRYGSDDGSSEASRCTKSYSSSSEKLSDSCLTQCKAEIDPLRYDDSQLLAHENGAAAGPFDGLMDSPRQYSCNGSNIFSNDGHPKKGTSKLHPIAKRRGKTNDLHKPRPRDRQLIQDRVKELRDLIPNGSKCSIDALLDRTVKHMVFLKNLSSQTEKLQHCSYSKVQAKDVDPWLGRPQTHQDQVSWAYQLGRTSKQFPLIIENLDQPGHLLVEMLCSEYGLFLEIAHVIRSMRLTILKGVLKNKSEELWAHFIVETSRGFHRLDILLPLMRLLQRNFPSDTPNM